MIVVFLIAYPPFAVGRRCVPIGLNVPLSQNSIKNDNLVTVPQGRPQANYLYHYTTK